MAILPDMLHFGGAKALAFIFLHRASMSERDIFRFHRINTPKEIPLPPALIGGIKDSLGKPQPLSGVSIESPQCIETSRF